MNCDREVILSHKESGEVDDLLCSEEVSLGENRVREAVLDVSRISEDVNGKVSDVGFVDPRQE